MDTEKDTGGAPVQTSFHLPNYFRGLRYLSLLFERGMHKPPSAERQAPFHQDHTQRIAAFSDGYLVFPVETLLRLAEGREGCEIRWDEWKIHAVIPFIPSHDRVQVCVSGCRLSSIKFALDGKVELEVYDFSMRGRAKYLTERVDVSLGGVRYLASTGTKAQLLWLVNEVFFMSMAVVTVLHSSV